MRCQVLCFIPHFSPFSIIFQLAQAIGQLLTEPDMLSGQPQRVAALTMLFDLYKEHRNDKRFSPFNHVLGKSLATSNKEKEAAFTAALLSGK